MVKNEPKETLRLTVPRRNVMLALLATASDVCENLNVHFRPENPEETRQGVRKGRLVTRAGVCPTVSLVGGTWSGIWPEPDEFDVFADYYVNGRKHRALVVPADYFTKAKHRGIVETDATIRVCSNGQVTVADDAIGRPLPRAARCSLLLPTWTAGLNPPAVAPYRQNDRRGSRVLKRTMR